MKDLAARLRSLDGKGYGAYKSLAGRHRLGRFTLDIDKVQVDPYAPPSLMRIGCPLADLGLSPDLLTDPAGRLAVEDHLLRRLLRKIDRHFDGRGPVEAGRAGQHILERTVVRLDPDRAELRLLVQLPASGRKIRGRQAARLLTEDLPRLAEQTLLDIEHESASAHVAHLRDVEALRKMLPELGLIAFIANGSVLARRSGDSDLPLEDAVAWRGPASLEVTIELPSGRTVTGTGIPRGITVIVGGGFHGKSTLLRAIERGVYPHIVGDGREWVVTDPDAISIRAEDGRAITSVDISPFITNLPSGADTSSFSTPNASGSTSQAAAVIEALEAGASALLIDEDTSATNFMIRDERMRKLIPDDREPITPFIDRARELADLGVSTVLVTGGTSQFLDIADHVIAMTAYLPADLTDRAQEISAARHQLQPAAFHPVGDSPRILSPACLRSRKPPRGRGHSIRLGTQTIELGALSQLLEPAQVAAIARALDLFSRERGPLPELAADLGSLIDEEGLSALSNRPHPGILARPRRAEVLAAVNRLRSLSVDINA